jgi:hypothetical protein
MAKPETGEVVSLPNTPAPLPPAPQLPVVRPTEASARASGVHALLDGIGAETGSAVKLAHGKLDEFENIALAAIAQAKTTLDAVVKCNETVQEHANKVAQAIDHERGNLARLVNARVRE